MKPTQEQKEMLTDIINNDDPVDSTEDKIWQSFRYENKQLLVCFKND